MEENKEQKFVVMAKPGPAFIVSKEEFEKLKDGCTAEPGRAFIVSKEEFEMLQRNSSAKENHERLQERIARYHNFKNIKDKTKKTEEHEFSL